MDFLNRTKFETPESVALEFTLAGIGSRAYALVADYTFLGLGITAIVVLASFLSVQLVDAIEAWSGNIDRVLQWLIAIFALLLFGVYVGYFVLFETLWQGQTPGKRMAKIRVVRDNGQPISLFAATLRALLRPIDDVLFVGSFLIAFTKREKRLGDLVAGTIVIQEETTARANAEDIRISPTARNLAEELPTLADMDRFTPADFAVIREYLLRRSSLESTARVQLSLDLASQVKQAIALETLPPGTPSDTLLEAVYVAYGESERYR
ncbi:MAG: RDD family protein [Cyanobacteria bacterium J06639_1]